jgi:hypothetical protein
MHGSWDRLLRVFDGELSGDCHVLVDYL